jgi:fructoselysine-6-P-deglycase FrlB-like protein
MAEITEPELRDSPPWAMQEMIEAEPELVRSILTDPASEAVVARVAAAVRDAGDRPPVSVVGCGSSDHAAHAVAALIADAVGAGGGNADAVRARQAFEAALEPGRESVLIAVSHEGETPATLAALRQSRASLKVAITANPDGPIGSAADAVLGTPLMDRSWCHTVGYLSPVAVGLRIAAAIGGVSPEAGAIVDQMASVLGLREQVAQAARALANVRSFVVCGSGIDATSARELALKIEEGVRLPAVARETETELHGHLVSANVGTAMIAIVTDPRSVAGRAGRADQLLRVSKRLGMPTLAILSASAEARIPASSTDARIVVADGSPGSIGEALLTSAMALQLLTLELLAIHGQNPDLIGRENVDQREAAAIASASFPI